jgi:enolase-phosphatase E1
MSAPAILLDIEGTTTPIDFVHSVLFPHATRRLPAFVSAHATEPDVAKAMRELGSIDAALRLMDQDAKPTPLKTLQGLIWKDGYERGDLRGVVFADVAPALTRWHADGRDVRIFSSGSILAQRLLFSTCAEGDLTRFLRGYFDTTTGPKKDAASYRAIAAAFGVPPGRIIFVSDVVEELDAARAAGMDTRLAVRAGNAPVPDPHGHEAISTFDEL